MYCSTCANELREGLKYCNRCGARTPLATAEAGDGQSENAWQSGNSWSWNNSWSNNSAPLKPFQLQQSNKPPSGVAEQLAVSVGFVGTAGVIALAILIFKLLETSNGEVLVGAIMLIMILGAIVFGVVGLLVYLILTLSKNAVAPNGLPAFDTAQKEIPGMPTGRLEAAREPAASVTEGATRTLQEIPIAKPAK